MSKQQPEYSPDTCLRNSGQDRRTNHTRAAFYSLVRRRRKNIRRDGDVAVGRYVDVHEPWLVYLALGALLLSTCDAFFTLLLLQHGSEELNPFMDYFIRKDEQLFFIVKFIMTACCVVFMVMHKNFRFWNYFHGYQILFVAFGAYALLVCYELYMLMQLQLLQRMFY